jgi:hypothetical protein
MEAISDFGEIIIDMLLQKEIPDSETPIPQAKRSGIG